MSAVCLSTCLSIHQSIKSIKQSINQCLHLYEFLVFTRLMYPTWPCLMYITSSPIWGKYGLLFGIYWANQSLGRYSVVVNKNSIINPTNNI